MTAEMRLEDSHDEGVEEGIKLGLEQGKIALLSKAIEERYHHEATLWLEGLTSLQLESIMKYIFTIDDFTTFKLEVEKIG